MCIPLDTTTTRILGVVSRLFPHLGGVLLHWPASKGATRTANFTLPPTARELSRIRLSCLRRLRRETSMHSRPQSSSVCTTVSPIRSRSTSARAGYFVLAARTWERSQHVPLHCTARWLRGAGVTVPRRRSPSDARACSPCRKPSINGYCALRRPATQSPGAGSLSRRCPSPLLLTEGRCAARALGLHRRRFSTAVYAGARGSVCDFRSVPRTSPRRKDIALTVLNVLMESWSRQK